MSSRRTVLFVNGSITVEGDTRVFINSVRATDAARYRIICVTPPGDVCEELRSLPDVEVRTAPLGPARLFLPGGAGNALAFGAGVAATARAAWRCNADVIYTYDRTRAAEAAFLVARALHKKLLFHAHYPANLKQRRLRRFVAFHSDRIIAISRFVARKYIEHGCPARRLTVVLNGVEQPRSEDDGAGVSSLRSALAIPSGAPVVGMVGRLSPFKGQEELIRASAILRPQFPDLRVLISGRDTDESIWTHGPGAVSYRAILEQIRAELDLGRCVEFLGFNASAQDVYRASDVVAAPSHAEPFGLVVIEAMLAGKPVVSCNAGGVPEIIADGETGWMVPPRSPQALATAIARLLADPQAAKRMGGAAKRDASQRFSLERYARDFSSVLDAITQDD